MTDIGGKCVMDKHIKLPPIKSPKLSKEEQKKEYDIKKIFKDLINTGMIVDFKSIQIIWSGLFPKVLRWKKFTSFD